MLSLVAIMLAVSVETNANSENNSVDEKNVTGLQTQKRTYNRIEFDSNRERDALVDQVNSAISKGSINEAVELVDNQEFGNGDLSPFDIIHLRHHIANACLSFDELECALSQYKTLLKSEEPLTEGFRNRLDYQIAQVYFLQQKYTDALDHALLWLASQKSPSANDQMLVAMAYYQLGQFNNAVSYALNGIEIYTEAGKTPKEGWLNLLRYSYSKLGQIELEQTILKQLAEHYPKKVYQKRLKEIRSSKQE